MNFSGAPLNLFPRTASYYMEVPVASKQKRLPPTCRGAEMPGENKLKKALKNAVSYPVKSQRAFTLLELLVVIAIIAILAALIFPALSRAKDKAACIVDINNLKQQTAALHMFAMDNNDSLPWANWLSGDENISPTPQGWLYTYNPTASGPARFDVQTGSFWPIIGNPKLFLCPRDNTNSSLFQQRGQHISSYVMNGAVCGYELSIYPPLKLGHMSPNGVVFWECDETPPANFNDGASSPDENMTARHLDVANYAAFDGSAGKMLTSVWINEVGDPNANNVWCYPDSQDGR